MTIIKWILSQWRILIRLQNKLLPMSRKRMNKVPTVKIRPVNLKEQLKKLLEARIENSLIWTVQFLGLAAVVAWELLPIVFLLCVNVKHVALVSMQNVVNALAFFWIVAHTLTNGVVLTSVHVAIAKEANVLDVPGKMENAAAVLVTKESVALETALVVVIVAKDHLVAHGYVGVVVFD